MTGGDGPVRRAAAMKELGRVVLLGLVTLLVACRGGGTNTTNVRVDLTLVPATPVIGPAAVVVHLADENGAPITGATVRVVGNMTHAGMTPVTIDAYPETSGRYVASDFAFTMGGDWVLTVQATLPNGRSVSRAFDIKGVGSGAPAPGHGGHGPPASGGL
jgi:hypothetical protein